MANQLDNSDGKNPAAKNLRSQSEKSTMNPITTYESVSNYCRTSNAEAAHLNKCSTETQRQEKDDWFDATVVQSKWKRARQYAAARSYVACSVDLFKPAVVTA